MFEVFELIEKVRLEKPLVHHITNWVTIYDCAQITRSTGALPVMAHAIEEVEEMVSLAGALVLNIGTLTPDLIESMKLAGKKANSQNIPVILDAVGAGATGFRTKKALELIKEIQFTAVKGNSSEIGALTGAKAFTKGVEAERVEGSLKEIAEKLAKKQDCAVVLTGAEDIVSGKEKTLAVKNGHELMGKVVGTGCMAASVLGAFNAVEGNSLKASACALAAFGIAGELAAEHSPKPMEFKHKMLDKLFSLNESDLRKARIEELK